jgi:hypothetical protein
VTASAHAPATTASIGAAQASPSATAAATDARTPPRPVANRRAATLAAIERARAARDHRIAAPTHTPAAPTAPGTDSTATTLDITDNTGDTTVWQKRALGTLNRLLGQCYDLGRAEDANLAGTLVVRLTLVGEPNAGGLLERVDIIDKDTTITQQTIRDCVTQQLYALELDPPPEGVSIERELSLEFP